MINHYKGLKKIYLVYLLGMLLILLSCAKRELKIGKIAIIPLPAELTTGQGHFVINEHTIVSVENEEQLNIATNFFKKFERISSRIPEIGIGKAKANIVFNTDSLLEDEAYELTVEADNIRVKSASGAGFFYAMQSLGQLMPPSFYSQKKQSNTDWGIPVVTIKDKPAFKWRGYMLDVSRHFFDKEQVKDVLDFMAEVKLNRFHWHLSDDNGWRIEIKKYPKLTEVGAWRVDHNAKDENTSNWWGRPTQKEGEKATYGGFYTQEDIKEIVAYAKER